MQPKITGEERKKEKENFRPLLFKGGLQGKRSWHQFEQFLPITAGSTSVFGIRNGLSIHQNLKLMLCLDVFASIILTSKKPALLPPERGISRLLHVGCIET